MNDRPPDVTAEALSARLLDFYHRVDARAAAIAALHAGRLKCGRGCSDCCVDDITVFTVEADNIRRSYPELPATNAPHPAGACAFLDSKNECRIYDARPYVCRTQGLPLHWVEESENGVVVAMRDICPVNDAGTPVEELAESECWTIGPAEEELAKLQFESLGNGMVREKLRELFFGNG